MKPSHSTGRNVITIFAIPIAMFFFIVVTLIQRAAAFIAHTFHLTGIVFYMICSAAGLADTSAGDPAYKLSVRNYDINHTGQFNAQIS